MNFPQRLIATCVLVSFSSVAPLVAQTPLDGSPQRTIANVRGGLYRFQDAGEVSVFLVTSDGIVVVDPLNRSTALWLQDELKVRFPNQTVRYVLLTSHHFQRARGGSTFGPDAELIGHVRFAEERSRAADRLPDVLRAIDANHDGVLQATEIASSPQANDLRAQDLDRNDVIRPAELYATLTPPKRTFREQLTITLGGQIVELISVPVADASDMSIVVFPGDRVAFAADVFPIHSLPTSIGPISTAALAASLRRIEQLPVDTILTGRGETATRGDVTAFREYLEELTSGVRAAFAAEQSLTDVQNSLTLENYRQWTNFSTSRTSNIAEVYRTLRRLETSLYGAGLYSRGSRDCGYTDCTIDGASSAGVLTGIQYSLGSAVMGARLHVNRVSTLHLPYYFAQIQQERHWVLAFPIGYTFYRSTRLSATAEGGPAIQVIEGGQTYVPSLAFVESRTKHFAWIAGGMLTTPLSNRLSVVVPVEFVRTGSSLMVKSRLTVGAGLRIDVHRGVGTAKP